jgi:hypothetical protein
MLKFETPPISLVGGVVLALHFHSRLLAEPDASA